MAGFELVGPSSTFYVGQKSHNNNLSSVFSIAASGCTERSFSPDFSERGIDSIGRNELSTRSPTWRRDERPQFGSGAHDSSRQNGRDSDQQTRDIDELARRAEKDIRLPTKQQELYPESQVRPNLTWRWPCQIGVGLENMGNTCYLNSILQCLSYVPPLAQHLLNGGYSQGSQATCSESPLPLNGSTDFGEDDILGAMQKLVGQVLLQHQMSARVLYLSALLGISRDLPLFQIHQTKSGSADQQAIRPRTFSDNLRKIGEKFRRGRQVMNLASRTRPISLRCFSFLPDQRTSGDATPYGQEDAHELLRHLVDKMAGSYLERRGVDPFASNRLGETTPIHRVFGGYLRSQLECSKCGFCSDTFDPFMDLAMNVEKVDSRGVAMKERSLQAALRRFTAPETLGAGNEWKCGGCNKLVEAEKNLSVFKPPNALVFQLKRFGFTNGPRKVNDHISFGDKLNLEVSGPERWTNYDLTGVVIHSGKTMSSGHYYAYVRSSAGCWARMNDSVVTKDQGQLNPSSTRTRSLACIQVTLDTVLRDKAYVLFYTRCPVPAPPAVQRPILPTPSPSLASSSSSPATGGTVAAGADGASSVGKGSPTHAAALAALAALAARASPAPPEDNESRKRKRFQELAGESERALAAAAAAALVEPPAAGAAVGGEAGKDPYEAARGTSRRRLSDGIWVAGGASQSQGAAETPVALTPVVAVPSAPPAPSGTTPAVHRPPPPFQLRCPSAPAGGGIDGEHGLAATAAAAGEGKGRRDGGDPLQLEGFAPARGIEESGRNGCPAEGVGGDAAPATVVSPSSSPGRPYIVEPHPREDGAPDVVNVKRPREDEEAQEESVAGTERHTSPKRQRLGDTTSQAGGVLGACRRGTPTPHV
ncbi:unnamed protein product [Ectocarpus sp. CCAP 1310/34]|nr:unnamed protein product [Ectocarpus sp. CCAP 1310/34]